MAAKKITAGSSASKLSVEPSTEQVGCIRKLHEAERVCSSHHLAMEMKGSNADRLRARMVARVVRATLAALLQADDVALDVLARAAIGLLERAQATQHARTGNLMITLPRGTYEHGLVAFAVTDVVPEKKRSGGRPDKMRTLRNTLEMWIRKGLEIDALAEVFATHAQSPFGLLPILRDEGVPLSSPVSRRKVRKAFAKVDRGVSLDTQATRDDYAERLIVAGFKALGMPKDKAKDLFAFANKAVKRSGGTRG